MNDQFLKDDLDAFIDHFPKNPDISDDTKNMFPIKAKGKRITHDMFGKDAKHPLCILNEVTGKLEPVGLNSARSARSYWDYTTESRVFPRADDLIRIAHFFKIGCYRSVALVLKGEWENFIRGKRLWPENGTLLDILIKEQSSKEYKGVFKPNTKDIFLVCNDARYGKQCDAVNLDQEAFDRLVREMILKNLHCVKNQGPEMAAFIDGVAAEMKMLKEAEASGKETFCITKSVWMELHEELGEQLLRLGNIQLENAHIVQRWRLLFGKHELALEEALGKVILLQRRIALKEIAPDLGPEELDKKMRSIEEQEKDRLANLDLEIKSALWFIQGDAEGHVDQEELANTERECKRVWRELWLLLHPDRLNCNPMYHSLTDEQKEHFGKLLERLSEIKPDELGHRPGQIGYNHRQLNKLLDIQATAKKILENAGFNTDVRLINEGKTLAEQVLWLEKEIEQIKGDIRTVKTEIVQEISDEEIFNKRQMLACPEQHDEIFAKMEAQTRKENEKETELTQRLEAIFNEVAV